MAALTLVLRDVSVAVFGLLALASIRHYLRARSHPAGWAAAKFGLFGAVLVASLAFPSPNAGPLNGYWVLAAKILLGALWLFPYFVYRFTGSFLPFPRWTNRLAAAMTIVVIAAGFALPYFPAKDAPRPWWVILYAAGITLQWTVLSCVSAQRLWVGGSSQPTVARRRARLLAAGDAGLSVLILISFFIPHPAPGTTIGTQTAGIACGVVFFLGLVPPYMLRLHWRRSETDAFGRAVARLMSATTATEVASAFLPAVATLVGAEGAALYGRAGNLVSSYSQHEGDPAASRVPVGGSSEHRVDMRSGYMVLHTSPFTPFFGSDELQMLHNLGGMTDLALERCAATARERDFVSNAAHELRTPITALTGLVDVLVEHRSEMAPKDIQQALTSMSRQGTRARSLVSNLLDLAQIDRGGAAFVEVPVHLADVTRRAIEEAPPPNDRRVEVSVPDDVDVIADASRLQQVMVNLLVNAYRYGGTSVMIAAAANNGSVKLSVTDNGPGVPPDVAPVIFEPFARGRDAKGLGSGLGLAIARRIVDAFGGTLSYEPAEPHGSRFDVTLRSATKSAA